MAKHSLTQQQTADYVGLTEGTVKVYCNAIKSKLGVRTLAGAVFEAVRRGIIVVE